MGMIDVSGELLLIKQYLKRKQKEATNKSECVGDYNNGKTDAYQDAINKIDALRGRI